MFTIAHNLQCRTTNVRTYLAVVSQVCSVMLPATDEIHNKRVSITKVQQQARHTENLRSCHDGPRVHQQMVFLALWRLWRLSAARAWEAQAQGMIQWSTTTQFLSSWVNLSCTLSSRPCRAQTNRHGRVCGSGSDNKSTKHDSTKVIQGILADLPSTSIIPCTTQISQGADVGPKHSQRQVNQGWPRYP